jgi:hypothetical protein
VRGGAGCWDHRQGDGEGHGGASPSWMGGGERRIYMPPMCQMACKLPLHSLSLLLLGDPA